MGRTYCDLLFSGVETMPVLGREVFSKNLAIEPGGGAFITAAHLHHFGRPAALLSRVGTDPLSIVLKSALDQSGIDLQFLEITGDAGPQVTVVTIQDNDRAFLSRRAGSAHPATLPAAWQWQNARHLHIAEYATLHEIPDLVFQARSHGLSVSLDPSWDETLIHGAHILDNAAGIDMFMPNLEEARAITGHDDPVAALNILAKHFPVVALKIGKEGAYLAIDGDILHQSAPDVVVVDTTGAGDAFNAGFIDSWLNKRPALECLNSGIQAGSQAVQMAGGAGKLSTYQPAVA
ncbi:ribokinase [Thalassospira mesophila]|uniref:Ribokinase n=1 Tax=Thalassospira mesophila TaxID=1293891 RepID=A0A1Y2KYA7_9PROT|nr:ribokinase [Thalassospira mesophila]